MSPVSLQLAVQAWNIAFIHKYVQLMWVLLSLADLIWGLDPFWLDLTQNIFNYLGALVITKDEFALEYPLIIFAFALVQMVAAAALVFGIQNRSYRIVFFWRCYHVLVMLLAFLSLARTLLGPENYGHWTFWFWMLHLTKASSYFAVNWYFLKNLLDLQEEFGKNLGEVNVVKICVGNDFMTGLEIGTKKTFHPGLIKHCPCRGVGRLFASISNSALTEFAALFLLVVSTILCYFYISIVNDEMRIRHANFTANIDHYIRNPASLLERDPTNHSLMFNLTFALVQVCIVPLLMNGNITNKADKILGWCCIEILILVMVYCKLVYSAASGMLFDEIVLWHFILFGPAFLCLDIVCIRLSELKFMESHLENCIKQETFAVEVEVERKVRSPAVGESVV